MSELIQNHDNRATIRRKLLAGASGLALAICVSAPAKAEDSHPLIWLDLGGQMALTQGISSKFTAPFMTTVPDPESYSQDIFSRNQRPPLFSFGMEGSISFQPEDSDWIFAAGIRYARAHASEHQHQQGVHPYVTYYNLLIDHVETVALSAAPLADAKSRNDETNAIIDFSAGKDVGLGLFGHAGDSSISAGVRFFQFSENSAVNISARPHIGSFLRNQTGLNPPHPTFYQYFLTGEAERRFRGIGPSLTWKASEPIAGNSETGELSLDWGINGAVLFGRQRTKVTHATRAYHLTQAKCKRYRGNGTCAAYEAGYPSAYPPTGNQSTRSRNAVVPNIGGFAGLTAQFKDAKVSIGYRADLFMNALDTGIDARKTSNLIFNGPYASISIGLGD